MIAFLGAAPLADLLVGQDERAARIEVVCEAECAGRLDGETVVIDGVTDTISVPLRDGPLTRVAVTAEGQGRSRLAWVASASVREAETTRCGASRVCVTLRFGVPRLSDRLAAASGDSLDAAACAAAQDDLGADPWDTGALRRVAQCRAAAGFPSEGAALLDRLLTVTNDPAAARARAALAPALDDDRAGG